MVEVFLFTVGNTNISELVRLYWHPPVRELGEVDDKYVIRTAEILLSPQCRRYDIQLRKQERKSNG